MKDTIRIVWLAALYLVMSTVGTHAADAKEWVDATKVGKARSNPFCPKGQIYDPIDGGTCWTCPAKYDRTIFAVNSKKACERGAYTVKKKAKKKKKGTGLLGTDCPKKQFLDLKDGRCYKCPKGYKHDPLKHGNQKGVCYKPVRAKLTKAKKKGSAGFCAHGQVFDMIGGGSCWTCPKDYARTIFPVDSDNACEYQKSGNCGKKGQRPCNIWERIPSCDKGLVEHGGKCYKSGDCGGIGQRACTVGERIPSCVDGAAEDPPGKCRKLKPGENPFLVGLFSYYDAGIDAATDCRKFPAFDNGWTSSAPGQCAQSLSKGVLCSSMETVAAGGKEAEKKLKAAKANFEHLQKEAKKGVCAALPLEHERFMCALIRLTMQEKSTETRAEHGTLTEQLECMVGAMETGAFHKLALNAPKHPSTAAVCEEIGNQVWAFTWDQITGTVEDWFKDKAIGGDGEDGKDDAEEEEKEEGGDPTEYLAYLKPVLLEVYGIDDPHEFLDMSAFEAIPACGTVIEKVKAKIDE